MPEKAASAQVECLPPPSNDAYELGTDALTMINRWLELNQDEIYSSWNAETNVANLEVDWMELSDEFPLLGSLLHEIPKTFENTARRQLSCFLKGQVPMDSFRFRVIPRNFPFVFNRNLHQHQGLIKLSGKVQAHESVRQAVWSRTVKCNNSACEKGIYPYMIYGENSPVCSFCNFASLLEDRARRVLLDIRYVLISQYSQGVEVESSGHFRRSLVAKLSDEMCNLELSPGMDVTVIGTIILNELGGLQTGLLKTAGSGSQHPYFFDVMSLTRNARNPHPIVPHVLEDSLFGISMQNSGGDFPTACERLEFFASLLAPKIIGFFKLKICFLLCAVSGDSDVRAGGGKEEIHLLCKGGHEELVLHLMRRLSEAMAPTPASWLNFTDPNAVLPRMICEKNSETSSWQLESSQILDASSGICFLPYLSLLKKSADAEALASVMDSQTITVGKDIKTQTISCKAKIIAQYSSEGPDLLFSSREASVLQCMGRQFDLVCDLQERGDLSVDRMISSNLFMPRTDVCGLTVDKDQLSAYLHRAASMKVVITKPAEKLLTAFFHTGRQALRTDLQSRSFYQLESLTRIAKAFAKLRFSETCQIEDAVFAISFLEETRAAKQFPTLLKFDVRQNDQENALLFHSDRVKAMELLCQRIRCICQIHGNYPEE